MDMKLGGDLFDSFVNYQSRLLEQYDAMAQEYGFEVIDAALPVDQIAEQLKDCLL
ncbi:MAG TPA: thymidylate kinase, partial [Ktedonobacter sp.]|nr:thymidylate kinase [Ktedonobacter sp.]